MLLFNKLIHVVCSAGSRYLQHHKSLMISVACLQVANATNVEEYVVIIVKAAGTGTFHCLEFNVGSTEGAEHFANIITDNANNAFLKVHISLFR